MSCEFIVSIPKLIINFISIKFGVRLRVPFKPTKHGET